MTLPYTYTPDVPQGNQQINTTQQPINYNFQDIASLISVNHVGFNTANTFGQHTFVNYVTQSSDPSTASAEMALYTKAVSDTNGVELFYRYPNNGSVLQLTGTGSNSGNSSSSATGGGTFSYLNSNPPIGYPVFGSWQYLSNGILMMTWSVSSTYVTTGTANPIPLLFPSPTYSYVTSSSATMPQFTQAVYNIQIAAQGEQATTSTPTTSNYAITDVNNTTANLYWTGTASTGIPGLIFCTAIGI